MTSIFCEPDDFEGCSITPMTVEEEWADYFAAQKPHVACLVEKDGTIHMRIGARDSAALKEIFDMLMEGCSQGKRFKEYYVRPI